MTTTTTDLEVCATLVAHACDGRSVPIGSTYPQQDRVWLSASTLRNASRSYDWRQTNGDENLPHGFGSAMLRRAAKAGLIAARDLGRARDLWRFTTTDLAAQWDAEQGMSDVDRAIRTAAAVRRLYAANMRSYGDRVHLWPVSTDLAAVPQDGITLAVQGGLLHPVKKSGPLTSPRGYLVPADEWDTYSDTAATYELRQTQLQERHDALVDQAHGIIGGDRRNITHLDTPQLDRLLSLIVTEGAPT